MSAFRTVALASLLTGATCVLAQDDRGVAAFLAELARALARNDRTALATMVRYPLTVVAAGVTVPVPDRAAFLRYFDTIFTSDVRGAIASGDAVRRGVVRISHDNSTPKVIAINVPIGGRGGARRGTQRVVLRAGLRSTQLSGALARGDRDSYVVFVKQGQLLEVRIEGVRGREIIARVLDAEGTAVDARAREGGRTWAGRVPASGDYRIDVLRAAKSDVAELTYALVVGVR